MTHFYDSSALVKLFVRAAESDALLGVIAKDSSMVASELIRVEVPRAVRRVAVVGSDLFANVFAGIHLVAVRSPLMERAALLEPLSLRTLDAVHLASALLVRDELDSFIAYDDRLLEAAEAAGLQVASPGR